MRTFRPPLASAPEAPQTAPGTPIRVAIVDDCPDVRFLLATVLELDRRFDVVAEASDAESALSSVADSRPDVVLVDLRLGADRGTSVIRELRRRGTTACVVVVTASTERDDHAAALQAGADAIQSKRSMTSTMVDELAQLVHRHASDPRRRSTPDISRNVAIPA